MADEVIDLSGLKNVDWSKIVLPQSVQGIISDTANAPRIAEQLAQEEQFRIDQEKLRQQILNDFTMGSAESEDKSIISNNILIYGGVGLVALVVVVLLLNKKK